MASADLCKRFSICLLKIKDYKMQFESFVRCTGKWSTSYYIYESEENIFYDKYTSHFIEMLKNLSDYKIFEISEYGLYTDKYIIDSKNSYDHDFWLNIFLKKEDRATIELFGKTMVYRNNKPVFLTDAMRITIDFDISEGFLWTCLKISNDDWLPYHFIGTAKVNDDYEKNASRLEKALSHFFFEKYKYEIDTGEETDVIGTVKEFRIDNPYATIDHELVIYDKRGRYIDSIDPKLIK